MSKITRKIKRFLKSKSYRIVNLFISLVISPIPKKFFTSKLGFQLDTAEPIVQFIATGDVTLAHRFNEFLEKNNNIHYNPFVNFINLFKNSLVLINLEGPLTTSQSSVLKQFTFKGNPEYVNYLVDAHIDSVNLANNHIGDYGPIGIIDTLTVLDNHNIQYCGAGNNSNEAGRCKIIETKGIKIGFLGFDDIQESFSAKKNSTGTAFCSDVYLKELIQFARKTVDVLCVSFHFGNELDYFPTKKQKFLARLAVDCGADVVIGHHPHVIQGIEKYKQGIIFYSLGNFCFGGNINPLDKDTFIPVIQLSKQGITGLEIIPCKISSVDYVNNFTPIITSGLEAKRILFKLFFRSKFL